MKKLVVLLALLALVAALSAYEAVAQVKEGEESEVLWEKKRWEWGGEEAIDGIFTPDETKILVGTPSRLLELDAKTGSIIREIPGIYGAKKFTADGEYFYTYDQKKVKYSTMEVVCEYKDSLPAHWKVYDFDVNEKAGIYIFTVTHALVDPRIFNSIFIYDEKTGKIKKITGIEDHQIYEVDISENGDYFFIYSFYDPDFHTEGGEKNFVTLWDAKTLKKIGERNEFAGTKAFSPDGKWLAITLFNNIRLYDATTFEKKWERKQGVEGGGLQGVAFSQDSKYVVTAGNSGGESTMPHIWDTETGALKTTYLSFNSTNMTIDKIHFNKNYQLLFARKGGVTLTRSKLASVKEPIVKPYKYFYDPNSKNIRIIFEPTIQKPISIELYNEIGKKIENFSLEAFQAKEFVYGTTQLVQGAYFFKIKINNDSYTEKFIKE